MSNDSNKNEYRGISGLTILGLIFITLKLMSVINWSWWWILLPIYGPVLVALGCVIIYAGFLFIRRSK